MKTRAAPATLTLALFVLAAPVFAQKTDVVVMWNGDRYTGEIKSYSEGRLTVSSLDAGDLSIKWNKISSITSEKTFDVELTDDTRLFGTLAPSDPPGRLTVVTDSGAVAADFLSVVRIAPIYQTFWRRFSGSFDLGSSYTEASQFFQLTVNGDATFRKTDFLMTALLSVAMNGQEGVPSTQRASLSTSYQYLLKNDWFVGGLIGFDRNTDLGLDLRATGGLLVGRYLVQTNRTQLLVAVGATANREIPVEGESKTSAEALVGGQFSTFAYDFPKLTFAASLKVFPSLTESGRVRLQLDTSVRREIVTDFYVSISIFDSFDNKPPTVGAATNDWGPVISIGYKF